MIKTYHSPPQTQLSLIMLSNVHEKSIITRIDSKPLQKLLVLQFIKNQQSQK